MYKKPIILSLTLIFVLSFAVVGFADDMTPQQLVQEARSQVKKISVHDLKKMMDAKEDIIILDVRDKEEFEKEHIKGAINISRGLLEFLVENKIPDKKARIVVY